VCQSPRTEAATVTGGHGDRPPPPSPRASMVGCGHRRGSRFIAR
jgi:hypothetical protein